MSAPVVGGRIYPGLYHDSVRLMRIGEALRRRRGILDAGLMMGTPANVSIFAEAGLAFPELDGAGPNDLVVAVKGAAPAVASALDEIPALLETPTQSAATYSTFPSIASALDASPAGTVGLVTVPGEHAPRVAREFVERGRHVMVFSDNVSLEDELSLKVAADAAGVIVMGPDCGTSLLGGAAIGFAGRVAPGRIGIVAASGTGAQTISTMIDRLGAGVSHIIGLGGRDLDDRISGRSLWHALDVLESDAETDVVVLVAKTAGPVTLRRLLRRLDAYGKHAVVCLLSARGSWITSLAGAAPAASLRDAAREAVRLAADPDAAREIRLRLRLGESRSREGGPCYLRGMFSGGTLAQEALDVARALLGDVASNLSGPKTTSGHMVLDLGADEYTVGRPHPMIDPRAQADAIVAAADRKDTGVVLFDVVLGFGAHEDPASIHGPLIEAARERARARGHDLRFIASVVGTDSDPQSWSRQAERLRAAGCVVFDDPARAAAFACLEVAPDGPAGAAPRPNAVALLHPERIVTVGSSWFTEALAAQRVNVAHVQWRPPARLDAHTERLLELME